MKRQPSKTALKKIRALTKPFDTAEYLETPEDIADFLSEAFATGDSGYITHAIGVAARAKGMSVIAEEAGVGRESLYKALDEQGNPRFATIVKVMGALGVKLEARVAS